MKSSAATVTCSTPEPQGDTRTPRDTRSKTQQHDRLCVDVYRSGSAYTGLANDVRAGLSAPQKMLPPKYFYDDHGAQLFDAICDLPEYYLTRTEQALLAEIVDDMVSLTHPAEVVEFGSGASRKTRIVLDALTRNGRDSRYIPIDVSEAMLRRTALALLHDYPRLRIHALVADYEQDLERIPVARDRLVLFLGSTIGNFTPEATAGFLDRLRGRLLPGAHFALGVDLVKPTRVLEAAYNDRAGLTAEFNRNVLRVINRQLDADFEPARFEHVAFFNRQQSQIEMHLRARTAHMVSIRTLGMTVEFAAGETIHTEVSRKFTPPEVETALTGAGFELRRWYAPSNGAFGLALARAV